MDPNPYAPPKAEVADVAPGGVAPPLWNPNAAASWSLLFSPAFGAFLHMKNWQRLGEPGKAATSKVWAIASLVVLGVVTIGSALLPDSKAIDALSRAIALALLLGWYFSGGRIQAAYVQARFGKTYPRRGWLKPIGITVLLFVGLFLLVALVVFAFDAPAQS